MEVHIDQSGGDKETGNIDCLGSFAGNLVASSRDASILNGNVDGAVDLVRGVDEVSAVEDKIEVVAHGSPFAVGNQCR